jgi:alkaline phosphatase D
MAYTRRDAIAGAGLAGAALVGAGGSAKGEPTHAGMFVHGVASGDPRSDRLIIWTRVTPEVPSGDVTVMWIMARDPQLRAVVKRGRVSTNAGRDFTVKIDVTGLGAGQVYYYGFQVGSQMSAIGKTQTAPRRGGSSLKIALVSCSNFPAGWFNAYAAVARRGDVDLVLHVGDYIYEHGADGYATEFGKTVGRVPDPPHECLTRADYRLRYAQYRRDPDLQAAHACAPWLVTWDDHETSNDAYKSGAENHNPATEGAWNDRKAGALQAYYEWMPLRDPTPGKAFDAINRSFDWGDLATIAMLETRLLARSKPLEYGKDIDIIEVPSPSGTGVMQVPDLQGFITKKVNAPDRELLGATQLNWLDNVLTRSVQQGKKWQVLGNQVIMARVTSPDLATNLPKSVREAIGTAVPEAGGFIELSKYNVPFNLDAWDGYPVARERLYHVAKASGARLVVCTGDTHSAWANSLKDGAGEVRGVEFGGTSVSSPSLVDMFAGTGLDGAMFNQLIVDKNEEVMWHDETKHGYTLVTLTPDSVRGDFMALDTITSKSFTVSTASSWQSVFSDEPAPLTRV